MVCVREIVCVVLQDDRPHVTSAVAMFLLSQVFLIISHAALVRLLTDAILRGDVSACITDSDAETITSFNVSSYPAENDNNN